jgi:magnesium transporter
VDEVVMRAGERVPDTPQRYSSFHAAVAPLAGAVDEIVRGRFEHMPELEWRFGYPAVLLLILVICTVLYRRFKRAGWL